MYSSAGGWIQYPRRPPCMKILQYHGPWLPLLKVGLDWAFTEIGPWTTAFTKAGNTQSYDTLCYLLEPLTNPFIFQDCCEEQNTYCRVSIKLHRNTKSLPWRVRCGKKWFAMGKLVLFFFNKVVSRIRGIYCHHLRFSLAQFHPRDKVFRSPKDVGYRAPIEEGG